MGLGVYAVEVGQGDAHLVLGSDRRAVQIDAGPANDSMFAFLRDRVLALDALVITHHDADHCGGALRILLHYGKAGLIGSVWSLLDWKGLPPDERKSAARVLSLVAELVREKKVKPKTTVTNGPNPREMCNLEGGRFELLRPTRDELGPAGSRGNAASAVVRLTIDGVGWALWCGDLPRAAWSRLLARAIDLRSRWFVVPHHGSERDWTGEEIAGVLGAIAPAWVVFSVGSHNPYGHPSRRWVAAAVRAGAAVACTQITPECCDGLPGLAAIGEAVLPRAPGGPVSPGGTACAGTWHLDLTTGVVERQAEHRRSIGRFERRLCGPAPA